MIEVLIPKELIGIHLTPNPPHKHTKWELVVFEKGTVKNYVNHEQYEANVGDVFLLGPMHVHAIQFISQPHLHKDLYLETEELETILAIFPESFKKDVLSGKICVNLKLNVHDFNSVIKNIHNIENLLLTQNLSSSENAKKFKPLILSIVQYVLSLYLSNLYQQKNIFPEWFLSFLQKLSSPEYFTKSVTELVAETNYSHTQFSKLFKKFCGFSLIEYLKTLRLSYAAELLINTDYSTLFICENCGYDSYSYFERVFKSKYKCSPQQYRKRNLPTVTKKTAKKQKTTIRR